MDRFFKDDNNLLYHLRNKTSYAKEYYAKKFKIKEDLFNDCEIGPVIDINKESYQLKEHFSV